MRQRIKAAAVKQKAIAATTLAQQLAEDQKFRKRLHAAFVHGARANRRIRSHFGLVVPFRQMATDPELRTELGQLIAELQAAWKQVEKQRHHRRRKPLLLVAGAAAATAVILPRSRHWLRLQNEQLRTPESE